MNIKMALIETKKNQRGYFLTATCENFLRNHLIPIILFIVNPSSHFLFFFFFFAPEVAVDGLQQCKALILGWARLTTLDEGQGDPTQKIAMIIFRKQISRNCLIPLKKGTANIIPSSLPKMKGD